MTADKTYPVQVLRDHTTALEAALSVCLADPGHKAVHKLRTETRRVEAQLLLLSQIPEIPAHRDESDALRKQLKRLRRAAGEVRDLDVHRKLLEEYAEPEELPVMAERADGSRAQNGATAGTGKRSKRLNGGPEAKNDGNGAAAQVSALQKGASELRDHLGKKRDEAAAELLKVLNKRQARAARAAEALLYALRGAAEFGVRADSLLEHASALLERDHVLGRESVEALDEDELHSVRKAAKAARYLAETLPEDRASVAAAEHFEAMQEAGGEWHDLLELARASKRLLGKSHELTATLVEQRDRNLALYREALAVELKPAEPKLAKKRARNGRSTGQADGRSEAAGVLRVSKRRTGSAGNTT